MDPITILMFALIAVLIFFMFRNGKKRQAAQQELQNGLRPGAEVMLQSGIFGTVDSIEEESNKVTILSGTSTFVVHRNAVTQIVAPLEGASESDLVADLAPDDDPAFGERLAGERVADDRGDVIGDDIAADDKIIDDAAAEQTNVEDPDAGEPGTEQKPNA